MENKILDLWPTSILKKTFDEHNNCKKDLISFIDNYKKDFPNGRSGNENKNLYESNYDIFSFADKRIDLPIKLFFERSVIQPKPASIGLVV